MNSRQRIEGYRVTMIRMLANLANAEDKLRLAVNRGWKDDAMAYVNDCEDIKDQLTALGCEVE